MELMRPAGRAWRAERRDGGDWRLLEAGVGVLEAHFELMLVNAEHVKQAKP
jgi:hypothetical protein